MIKTRLFQFIIYTLKHNPGLTANDLLEEFKREKNNLYELKLKNYPTPEETDKQLRSEIISNLTSKRLKGGHRICDHFEKITDQNTRYKLTGIGQNCYDIIFDDEEITEDIIEEEDNIGFVYLLKAKSSWWSGVYKIGKAQNIEARLNQISKDNRYGMFGFEIIDKVKVYDYAQVEKILHNILHKYRVCKNNGFCDTEIFIMHNDKKIKDIFKNTIDYIISLDISYFYKIE